MARLALDDDEYDHAAKHLGGAVGYAPDLPEVHEALAELLRRFGSRVLDLFPVDGDVYIGTVVARAHLSAALGQPAEALPLLVSATRYEPGMPWAAVPWVEAADLPGRLDAEVLLRTFVGLAGALPDPVPEPDRAALLPYLTLARHSVRAHGQDGPLLGAASAVGRRLGAFDEAVAWAAQAGPRAPAAVARDLAGGAPPPAPPPGGRHRALAPAPPTAPPEPAHRPRPPHRP